MLVAEFAVAFAVAPVVDHEHVVAAPGHALLCLVDTAGQIAGIPMKIKNDALWILGP